MSTYIVDALMVGRLANSALAISASSLGNTIFYAIVFGAIFLLNGLETLVAQAAGVGERDECVRLLAQSLWLVVLGAPSVVLLTLAMVLLLPHFGTPANIVAETRRYTLPLLWSTLPLMLYMALRRFLQSVSRVGWITVSLVTAAAVNWAADRVLIFGTAHVHAFGIAGSAWATLLVRLYMLLLLIAGTVLAIRRDGFPVAWSMLRPDARRLRALFRIGWPSGLQYTTELGISTFMGVLCSRLGAVLLAAHQVVLDLQAFVYQVPAGLSYATIVRVGQAAGRNDARQVKRAANVSFLLAGGFMAVASTLFAVFARHWASLYTNSPAVVVAAVPIFAICGVMLMGDATFVIAISAMTGLGDTRTPLVLSLVSNWLVGMPLAYFLCFHAGLSLRGLWLGRAAGSVLGGVLGLLFWRRRVAHSSHTNFNVLPAATSSLPSSGLTAQL